MTQVPENISVNIRDHVIRDLNPSPSIVFGKTAIAVILGGFVSLYICGQFGFGMTIFAKNVNHNLHHGYGGMICALACGGIFAVMPVLVLRLLSSPMQFRVLLRKRWEGVLIWTASFGGMLAWHGNMGSEPIYLVGWLVAALVTFKLMGEITQMITKNLVALQH